MNLEEIITKKNRISIINKFLTDLILMLGVSLSFTACRWKEM